jgi:hypothetical protein
VESTAAAAAGQCTRCRAPLASALAICPQCGEVRAAPRPDGPRRLRLLLGLTAALALVMAVQLWRRPSSVCRGGDHVTVEWRADPGTPRLASRHPSQIDPAVTPYVRLAVLRQLGNAAFGDKSDHEYGHIHQAQLDVGIEAGGNAFFNAPARRLGFDQVEVTTTIALAHPGPIARALRDRLFPSGQVMMIVRVIPGSAADRGGLKVNDVMVTINGQPVPAGDDEAFKALTGSIPADGTMRLEVLRAGALQTLTLVRPGDKLFGYTWVVAPVVEDAP